MNYYNEFDTKTAAWLRELISAKLIPAGDVDTRSIVDVSADELRGYTQCHFFAGIGGWSLALQLAGWPADKRVWSGSCPCQPFSTAGKGLAQADERHLWPVFFNLIKECRPPVVFGEQVASSAVVGPSKPTRKMQDLRDKQALLGILQKLEGGIAGNMQGVCQGQGAYSEEVKAGDYQARLQEMEGRKPRPCTCECGKEQSQEFQNSIRPFSGEYSEEDRQRLLRSDWNSIRPDYSKSMECSIIGSNNTKSGLHNGEYQSGLICPKCHGELVGSTEDSGGIQWDIEVETRSIRQIIGSDWDEASGAPEECWLDGISTDLGEEGYACGSAVLGAHSVGSPHIRQRLYWVAYSDSGQCKELRPSRDIPSEQPIQSASCDSASDRMADPEGIGIKQRVGRECDREKAKNERGWRQENRQSPELESGCYIDGLAQPDELRPQGHELLQSGLPSGSSEADRLADGGMVNAECSGLMGSPISNRESAEARREEEPNDNRVSSEGCAIASGMGNPIMSRCETCDSISGGDESRPEQSQDSSAWSNVWVAQPSDNGTRGEAGKASGCGGESVDTRTESLRQDHGTGSASGADSRSASSGQLCTDHWSNCTIIPCRDGKTRRIPTEPAFFPLAHGIPARVVRLRGYGNAIVPQVAAEFIQAFQETQAATA
jgi:site-specific DNA-cytosine methylase